MIFGKWTALKYSGTSVDVVIVVCVAEVVVVFVIVELLDVIVVLVAVVVPLTTWMFATSNRA